MLQNAYLDVKIGVDTDENEPKEECCVVAEATCEGGDVGELWRLSSRVPGGHRPLASKY